jgi:hypothetical protein
MVAKVFISYRRDDARWQARNIHEVFCKVLSAEHVFMDISSIRPGDNFRKILSDWVAKCDVLLALIGPGWINATDPNTGLRRLDNPSDFVRIEIGEALARDIPVVPVLLDSTPLPDIGMLPDDLKGLVDRQAEFVEYRTFDADVERLIKKLGLAQQPTAGRNLRVVAAGGAVGLLLLSIFFFFGAQSRDLSGPWICYDLCRPEGGNATIKQNGINLVFRNEFGAESSGRWVNSGQVIATEWGGLLGDLSLGGRVIQWRNPSRWIRPARCFFTYACPALETPPATNVPLSLDRERALKPKDTFSECANCPEMMVVPAGTFTMGSPSDEKGRFADETPQHRVTFARPFAVGKFAVTFDEWMHACRTAAATVTSHPMPARTVPAGAADDGQ